MEEGLEVRPMPFGRYDPRLGMALYRLIMRERFSVVDAHNPQSQYWGLLAAWAAGCPGMVSTVHTVYREAHHGLRRPYMHEGALRINKYLNCRFIAVSRSIQAYLLSLGVAPALVKLSYNGIEASSPPPKAGLRHDLNWENAKIVAIIGRLEQRKGHSFLFQALEHLQRAGTDLRCVVVGAADDTAIQAQLTSEVLSRGLTDRVHFTGFRSDVRSIMAEVDLVCIPSTHEGLPYVALEAAQIGLPLLVSAVDGLTEVFTHNQNAFMVRPGDVQALADGLALLVADRSRARILGEAARALVAERFSVKSMTDDMLALYDGFGKPTLSLLA
jgi:glycosyltransferase involved in cell wall biosynthesis